MATPTGRVAASLQKFEPPTGGGSSPGAELDPAIEFMFNPNRLTLNKSANWIPHVNRASASVGAAEFSGSAPRTLNLEIFMDATDTHSRTVHDRVEALLTCCVPTDKSITAKAPSPPWVRFSWGQFQTVSFNAYVASVNATYTLFDTNGIPLRATCSLTLHEVGGTKSGQNPTSGTLSARRAHRITEGDCLEALAWREYGDPTVWRVIAEANDIDDPAALTIGRQLLLPAADELAAGAHSTSGAVLAPSGEE